jgi:hypothetical protein
LRAQQERQKSIAAAGLGSTILTGGLGASDYGSTAKATKLGETSTG